MVHDSFEKKCLDKGDHFNLYSIEDGNGTTAYVYLLKFEGYDISEIKN